jgi:hypothetical protein
VAGGFAQGVAVIGEIMKEPGGEGVGPFGRNLVELLQGEEADFGYLLRIRAKSLGGAAEKDLDQLVLDHVLADLGAISGVELRPERHLGAELLAEAADRGGADALARARMAAAAVPPQPARMIFAAGAALDEEPPLAVDEEDGESAVEQAAAVDLGLAGGALRAAGFGDEDQLLFGLHRAALARPTVTLNLVSAPRDESTGCRIRDYSRNLGIPSQELLPGMPVVVGLPDKAVVEPGRGLCGAGRAWAVLSPSGSP